MPAPSSDFLEARVLAELLDAWAGKRESALGLNELRSARAARSLSVLCRALGERHRRGTLPAAWSTEWHELFELGVSILARPEPGPM